MGIIHDLFFTSRQIRVVSVEVVSCRSCPQHVDEDDDTFYCKDLERDIRVEEIDPVTGFPRRCNAPICGTWG